MCLLASLGHDVSFSRKEVALPGYFYFLWHREYSFLTAQVGTEARTTTRVQRIAGRSHTPGMVAFAASLHPVHCSNHLACWHPHPENAFPSPSNRERKAWHQRHTGKRKAFKMFVLHLLCICVHVAVRRQLAGVSSLPPCGFQVMWESLLDAVITTNE